MLSNPNSTFPPDETAQVRQANADAFIRILRETGETCRDISGWRACTPTLGVIAGIDREVECVATNGVLGMFLKRGWPVLWGHVQHFVWVTPVEHLVQYYDKATKKWKVFTAVKDRGAPGPLHSAPKRARETKVKEPKPRKPSQVAAALAMLGDM